MTSAAAKVATPLHLVRVNTFLILFLFVLGTENVNTLWMDGPPDNEFPIS